MILLLQQDWIIRYLHSGRPASGQNKSAEQGNFGTDFKICDQMALPLMVFINITDGTDKKNLYESWPILVIAVGFYICIYAAGAMAVKFFKQQESRVGIYRAMLLFGSSGL